eukprot:6482487-Amphidinium_carterae.1
MCCGSMCQAVVPQTQSSSTGISVVPAEIYLEVGVVATIVQFASEESRCKRCLVHCLGCVCVCLSLRVAAAWTVDPTAPEGLLRLRVLGVVVVS